jgi:hypothetical protein
MALALQQLINGLTLGAVYGLIAIGYTMVYGIIGMINFAHGDIYMVSAFIAVTVFTLLASFGISSVPLSLLVVLLVAVFFTSIYGWTVERTAYRPLRGSTRLAPLISAIGMSIFLQNMVQLTQGARVKPIAPVLVGGIDLLTIDGFTVRLAYSQDPHRRRHRGADGRLHLADHEDLLRPPATLVRAGPDDDGAARHQCRPDDFADLHARRRARRRRRGHGHRLLRRRRFLHRLRGRHQGLHRCRPRRYRLAAGGDARRPADRPDRSLLGGLSVGRIQGRGDLHDPHPGADVPPSGLLGRPEVEKV